MYLTVKQIADVIKATIEGDPDILISGVSSFDQADSTMITFAETPAFLSKLETSNAGAVIVPKDFNGKSNRILLKTDSPKLDFFRIVKIFHPQIPQKPGIHPTAVIGANVTLGDQVSLGPNVVIEDNVSLADNVQIMANSFVGRKCIVGEGTVLRPNVTLLSDSIIGVNVLIQSGTVIGSDGYGFTRAGDGHEKLIHTGHVEIGDDVEIGACNTIDRGTLGATRIGKGVKTDNQVHIAHNVEIGEHTLIVAQVGIAGSAKIGKQVIIAGKAGISGHLSVGDNAIIGPFAGISTSVEKETIVSGSPQMPHKTWLKAVNIIPRLPEMRKKLLAIERMIKNMKKDLNN